jgi:hypothetical protein
MSAPAEERFVWLLPVALVTVTAALFIGFVYGYPLLFPIIESGHHEYFEANVAQAIADGDTDKALLIAARAVELRPQDSQARAVYGKLLLDTGDTTQGLALLDEAVSIRQVKVAGQDVATRRPYYLPAARHALGVHAQQRPIEAIAQFELARGHGRSIVETSSELAALQYQTYASQGYWSRALAWGTPDEADLNALKQDDLLRLARVCDGAQNWVLLATVSQILRSRFGDESDAAYFLGRAAAATSDYSGAVALFQPAVTAGNLVAAYHLGDALDNSGQHATARDAFLQVPSDSIYRAFAIARVLESTPQDEALRAELITLIDALAQRPGPTLHDGFRHVSPIAVEFDADYFASGGMFPVLVLWQVEEATSSADPDAIALQGSDDPNGATQLRIGSRILQMQWAENQVLWDSVYRVKAESDQLPGWIDTAREWYALREDAAFAIVDDAGPALTLPKLTWLNSVPAKAREGVGYLLAAQVRDPDGHATVGWQALNEQEQVVFDETIEVPDGSADYVWRGGYLRSQLQWAQLRASLRVLPRSPGVAFRDVMLVALREPEL